MEQNQNESASLGNQTPNKKSKKSIKQIRISTGVGVMILLAAFTIAVALLFIGDNGTYATDYSQSLVPSGYQIGWWKAGYEPSCEPGVNPGSFRCYYKTE